MLLFYFYYERKIMLKKVILFISSLFLITVCKTGYAEQMPYMITPIFDKSNQIENNINYFYLYESPNSQDTIQFKVKNYLSKPLTLNAKISNLNNSNDGELDYSGNYSDSPVLKNKLTSMIKGPQKIIIPPDSTKILSYDIKTPRQKFDGIVGGGITFSENIKKEATQNHIANAYSYTYGVFLSNSKKEKIFKKNKLTINKKKKQGKLYIELINNHPYIYSEDDINISVKTLFSGDKTIKKFEHLNIAPYQKISIQSDINSNARILSICIYQGKKILNGIDYYNIYFKYVVILLLTVTGVFTISLLNKFIRDN